VLFARLLEGMPRRSLALRFGSLELARVAVYVTQVLAAVSS
jgi:hypothetical protein